MKRPDQSWKLITHIKERTPHLRVRSGNRGAVSLIIFLSILLHVGFCAPKSASVSVTWLGQSCFVLETSKSYRIAIDPYGEQVGYPIKPIRANVVFISHEHFDHNNTDMVPGAKVIRGLKDNGKSWNEIHDKLAPDVFLQTVDTYHDTLRGQERGLNSVAVLNVAGLRIVHLGDVGHLLDAGQIAKIGPVDILMIPVGGTFTIDGNQARAVVSQLHPKVVIPMHYRTKYTKLPIDSSDAFLNGITWPVHFLKTDTLVISRERLPKSTSVFILEPLSAGSPYRL